MPYPDDVSVFLHELDDDIWNDASTVFKFLYANIGNSASHADSKVLDINVSGTSLLDLGVEGRLGINGAANILSTFSVTQLGDDEGIRLDHASEVGTLDIDSAGTLRLANTDDLVLEATAAAILTLGTNSVLPANNTVAIGSSSSPIADVWADNFHAVFGIEIRSGVDITFQTNGANDLGTDALRAGVLYSTYLDLSGHLFFRTNNTSDIGTAPLRAATIYCTDLNVTNIPSWASSDHRYLGRDEIGPLTGSVSIDFDAGSYFNKNGDLTGNVTMGAMSKTSTGWCTLAVQQTSGGGFTIDWASAGITPLPPQPFSGNQEVTRYDLYFDEDYGWTWDFNAGISSGIPETSEPILTSSGRSFNDKRAKGNIIRDISYQIIA